MLQMFFWFKMETESKSTGRRYEIELFEEQLLMKKNLDFMFVFVFQCLLFHIIGVTNKQTVY